VKFDCASLFHETLPLAPYFGLNVKINIYIYVYIYIVFFALLDWFDVMKMTYYRIFVMCAAFTFMVLYFVLSFPSQALEGYQCCYICVTNS